MKKTPQLSISNFTGVLSKIQKLRMEVDNGNLTYLDLTDSLDVYIIGGLQSTCPLVFWLLALESHDLSQAEIERIVCYAEQI